uniref:Uncharacterized protein n=1 Tax=Triticum urartu TaxID=4572 RepID=A0A8R7U393_TRIUA
MFAVTDFCQSPLKRSLVQQTIPNCPSSVYLSEVAGSCKAWPTATTLGAAVICILHLALVQRQVLGIPQHKQRHISVDATAVDDALKLPSVTGLYA